MSIIDKLGAHYIFKLHQLYIRIKRNSKIIYLPKCTKYRDAVRFSNPDGQAVLWWA